MSAKDITWRSRFALFVTWRRPILHPPAPPFATIMQRKDVTAESLTNFINKTHGGLDEPNGMPNPNLADYQIKQVVAYLMSLKK
jgi:cytochrome c1